MNQSKYVFELFNTHNSSHEEIIPLAQSTRTAQEIAKRLSMKYYKVVVSMFGDWEQYEKGQRTEWSFPDGLPLN